MTTNEADAERKNRNLLAEVYDTERQWLTEVLTDFRIPFDDHKTGRRIALTNWMSDHASSRQDGLLTPRTV